MYVCLSLRGSLCFSPKPFSVLSLKSSNSPVESGSLKSYIPVVFISGHAAHSLLTLFCILNVILIGLLLFLFMRWTYTYYFYVNNVLTCLIRKR